MRRWVRRIVARGLDLLLPTDCFACGAPLEAAQLRGACAVCWSSFRPVREPFCRRCGLPAPETTDLLGPARGICASCVLAPHRLDAVRAAVVYDAQARRFLLRAKRAHPELLGLLARQLLVAIQSAGIASGLNCLVPAPSHAWTNLRRGFCPGSVLARELARPLGLTLRDGILVRRLVPLGGVKGLGRAHRRRLLARVVVLRRPLPENARILLIDDLMTTGTTLEACCLALRAGGAQEVRAAVWARALPPGWSGPRIDVFPQPKP